MAELEKAGGDLKAGLKSYFSLLEESVQELDELESLRNPKGFVMAYFGSACDVLKSFVGLSYKRNGGERYFFGHRGNGGTIHLGEDDKIKIIGIRLETGLHTGNFLVCERRGGVITSCVRGTTSAFQMRENKISNYVDQLLGKDYTYVTNTLLRIHNGLLALIGFLPKPLAKTKRGLEGLFLVSKRFSELERKVIESAKEMSKYALCDENFSFSAGELLEAGVLSSIKPKKLERPVLALFRARDQTVPKIMGGLREKNPKSFLHLLKILEVEAREEFFGLQDLPLSDVRGELSYFKNCGLDVEDYKKQVVSSVKENEKKRRAELNKQLRDMGEV